MLTAHVRSQKGDLKRLVQTNKVAHAQLRAQQAASYRDLADRHRRYNDVFFGLFSLCWPNDDERHLNTLWLFFVGILNFRRLPEQPLPIRTKIIIHSYTFV